MAQIYSISTGEQSVTATGAVTGTLDTSALPKIGFVHVRVRGLTAGQSIRIGLEDTANSSAFSDAQTAWVIDTAQGVSPDGNVFSKAIQYELPDIRMSASNNKLRLNVFAITASTTVLVEGYLSQ